MIALHDRVAALDSVLAQHLNQPFVWRERDCARVVGDLFLALGKPDPTVGLGNYTTSRGARLQLKRRGFKDFPPLLDAMGLERIAPAMTLPGDIIGLPGDGGWTALALALGDMRVAAFVPLEDATIFLPGDLAFLARGDVPMTAWRLA